MWVALWVWLEPPLVPSAQVYLGAPQKLTCEWSCDLRMLPLAGVSRSKDRLKELNNAMLKSGKGEDWVHTCFAVKRSMEKNMISNWLSLHIHIEKESARGLVKSQFMNASARQFFPWSNIKLFVFSLAVVHARTYCIHFLFRMEKQQMHQLLFQHIPWHLPLHDFFNQSQQSKTPPPDKLDIPTTAK